MHTYTVDEGINQNNILFPFSDMAEIKDKLTMSGLRLDSPDVMTA
jgi:hypothetical protein